MIVTAKKIKAELKSRGPAYYGDDSMIDQIAEGWIDDGFGDDAADWMDAGFWCPTTAAAVRDLGIAATEVAARCNDYITGFDDPVYSMCNGDLSVHALTE